MFGAIYIGLSGLNAYSRGLQQVSNNVANLNTTGFKGSTVSFRNLYGASDRGGLSMTGKGGGDGYGVAVADSTLNFKQGELRPTDRDLDLSVDGNGFLVLLDGDRTLYARTGSFEVDPAGFIVMTGTDYRLATLDGNGRAVSLSIDAQRTSAPKPTSAIRFADNLSSTAQSFAVGDLRVFDATGAAHVWTAQFTRDANAAAGSWSIAVTDDTGAAIGTQTLKFIGGMVDPATSRLDFTDAASGLTVAFDFSGGVSSFSGGEVSTLRAANIDGYGAGTVTGIAADAEGRLELSYSNGQSVDGGAIALADFRDPTALEQRNGVFAEQVPGQRMLLASDDPRVGLVRSQRLEASNVDLSQQFGDLILIQRGFQASSQIVSVSNDMIQQLFGIRGQG
ncbi:flagellar hook-basal body complex protein [Sphingomonas sp. CFBP 13720]|uniref:flagellar hook-basal body complex protein n=1 Tax=Sphingomonas sp. CFBP 13720 TaxID=2775302 RepID=UPI0017869EAB|nr:flagellar hook-basal body complex protein [Sphingomonas sp. CFBP 13720]MBD8679354.1 flagellar hook-basal body complex protein [Sphingomonas sp. CFBP 13720]